MPLVNTYYLEYTGTSMATPNAAGGAHDSGIPRGNRSTTLAPGALVKALMEAGAQDIGTRDIPNDDEGWGRESSKHPGSLKRARHMGG